MTKTYYIDDRSSSKAIFMRHLKACVENDVREEIDDLVDENYEAVTLFGHIFLPSELLKTDSDLQNKIFIEYVDKIYSAALSDLNEGLTHNFDGVDFKIKEEE